MTANSPDTAAAIACRGLTKRYGTITALDGLDLDVPAGSVFGFLGPNGAGKTTTLRILTSLAQASAGSATVGGVAVGQGEPNRAGKIGYLDQDPRFYGWMRGRELLAMVGRLYAMDGPELRSRIGEVLEQVGLADAADRRIGGYSGGMRQRLGLAQAILNRPPVLLLDEPVSALDPEGRRDMLTTIRSLGRTSTVLFSTHILNDVERVCDRVAILDHGRLVTEAPVDELLERYAADVYLVEPEPATPETLDHVAAALGAVEGVVATEIRHAMVRVSVTDAVAANRPLLAALAGLDMLIASFERQRPTLEDVFLRLVGRDREEAA
ncbi:MAG TPA: ABC transporter ATP-binding protein [Candidatus Limnocylindria bacterium]|jgi:ABC-2 type transport system ATP-binding protein|nr:ABC transporter ATP-binding protein [Candidatus Limnocylindria bacterium]